jgi:hypothetical protein
MSTHHDSDGTKASRPPSAVTEMADGSSVPDDTTANGVTETRAAEKGNTEPEVVVVDWEGPDDPENPKKCVDSCEH